MLVFISVNRFIVVVLGFVQPLLTGHFCFVAHENNNFTFCESKHNTASDYSKTSL